MNDMNLCSTARCIPLLIQQNIDGSDFFNRSWAEFKVGFNDSRGNYWLGNDLLSKLSLNVRYKLRFDLQARNGTWYYAEYSSFVVQSEAQNYELKVSRYSGNVGYDAFGVQTGMMFTTYDRDNDPWTESSYNDNCAVRFGGGFWYTTCGHNHVNAARWDFRWYLSDETFLQLQSSRMWLMCL